MWTVLFCTTTDAALVIFWEPSFIYEVCLKSNETVCAVQLMFTLEVSALCYDIGQPLLCLQMQFQLSVSTVLCFTGLCLQSL